MDFLFGSKTLRLKTTETESLIPKRVVKVRNTSNAFSNYGFGRQFRTDIFRREFFGLLKSTLRLFGKLVVFVPTSPSKTQKQKSVCFFQANFFRNTPQ